MNTFSNSLLGALLLGLTASAAEEPIPQDCHPIDYQSPVCEKLEERLNDEVKTLCATARDKKLPLADLEAQLEIFKTEPLYPKTVKKNVLKCLNAYRFEIQLEAKTKGK